MPHSNWAGGHSSINPWASHATPPHGPLARLHVTACGSTEHGHQTLFTALLSAVNAAGDLLGLAVLAVDNEQPVFESQDPSNYELGAGNATE